MNVKIRTERINDSGPVYSLVRAAFKQEDEARLITMLRRSNAFIPELSLVATMNDTIVGHILFTKIKIINREGGGYESLALAPMAVLPVMQKKGIGGNLVRYGLDKCRKLGYQSVIVLGHEHYYPKFGFKPARQWSIMPPFSVPDNVFMGIELVEDGLSGVTGVVQYAKEFAMI
jgi:predicted N-acetyltransferase YhbS